MDIQNVVTERFLRYVKVDTQSAHDQESVPSTEKQWDLARLLEEEMKEMGLESVWVSEHGYVYASLPANTPHPIEPFGLVAHMDTSPDFSGKDVRPQILPYNGGNVPLGGSDEMTPERFPALNDCIGQTLITTDGSTLLGADNKAGIAEILTAISVLQSRPDIPHGPIRIAFTPDEEVGRGADFFDVEGFDARFAYTVDGGPVGELTYESFNAASAKVNIRGESIHPGHAKDKMVNAALIGLELVNLLPAAQRPEHTEDREGFFLLHQIEGSVESAHLSFLIRDHDRELFEQKKRLMENAITFLNQKYEDRLALTIEDSYYNMGEKIEPVMEIVDLAREAMEELGIPVNVVPIRGGTDGSRLSFMGLPTPNLFTGGYNYHGKYEFIPVEAMEKAVELIVRIAHKHAKRSVGQ